MPQHALHNVSQAIHTDGRPPLRFLLVSSVSKSQWVVSLFSSAPALLVWRAQQSIKEVRRGQVYGG
jgi:hypothetical protein